MKLPKEEIDPEYCKHQCAAGKHFDKSGCSCLGDYCRNPEGLNHLRKETNDRGRS